MNLLCPVALISGALIFAMFGASSTAGAIIFAIFYGFFSGGCEKLSLTSVAYAVTDTHDRAILDSSYAGTHV